jgi:hypothetical protein
VLRAAIAQSPDATRRLHNIGTVSSPGIRDTAAAPVLAIPRLRRKNISTLGERLKEIRKRHLEAKVKPFTTFTILIPPHSPVLLDTRGALPKVRLVDEDGQDHTPKSLITIGREMLVAVVHVIHSVPRRT